MMWPLVVSLLQCSVFAGVEPTPTGHEAALATATVELEALRLEPAVARLEALLADPSLTPPIRVRALVLLGLTRAGQVDEVRASDAFSRALALDPGVALPADTSPKVRMLFEQCRARALKVSVATPPAPLSHPTDSVSERLAHGRARFEALDFDAAAIEFSVLAQDPRATEAELLEANLWAGAANQIVGNDTVARLHYLWVLRRRPDHPVPLSFAPRVRHFFELVRSEVVATPEPIAPSARPTPGFSGLPALTTAMGGGLVVIGGVVMAVGAGPFFAHDAARQALLRAAEANADGAAAADQQISARAAWESWGSPLVLVGAGAIAAGAVMATAGGAWWTSSP